MQRMFLLAASLWFGAVSGVLASQSELLRSVPEGGRLVFKAFTGDTVLGTHQATFRVEGDLIRVQTQIDLEARVLMLPVYAYRHRGEEFWRGGELVGLNTQTNDDGDKEFVNAQRGGAQFDIKSTAFNGLAPPPLAPTSYWAYTNLKIGTWLNTQTGKLLRVRVTQKGEDTIQVRGVPLRVRRYQVSGDIDLTLWYDAQNRRVRSVFAVDKTVIRYELQ